jgi:hypothetical protein
LREFARNAGKPQYGKNIPASLGGKVQEAYELFVQRCAEAERSTEPLGIVRPGILDVFSRIGQLKDLGLAGGAFIYSNNPTQRLLHFIADVIQAGVGRTDLICDYVHMLDERRNNAVEKERQTSTKRIATILRILQSAPCNASVVPTANDIFFFDDMIHPNIRDAIGDRYIQVGKYEYEVDAGKMGDIYIQCLRDVGILDGGALQHDYFDYMGASCFFGQIKPTSDEATLRREIRRQFKQLMPLPYERPVDDGTLNPIVARLDAMLAQNNLGNNPLNAIQVNALTGGRRRKRSSRKTKKASRKNRRNNRTKWQRQ